MPVQSYALFVTYLVTVLSFATALPAPRRDDHLVGSLAGWGASHLLPSCLFAHRHPAPRWGEQKMNIAEAATPPASQDQTPGSLTAMPSAFSSSTESCPQSNSCSMLPGRSSRPIWNGRRPKRRDTTGANAPGARREFHETIARSRFRSLEEGVHNETSTTTRRNCRSAVLLSSLRRASSRKRVSAPHWLRVYPRRPSVPEATR